MNRKAIYQILVLLILVPFPESKALDRESEKKEITEKQMVYKTINGIELNVDLFIPERSDRQVLSPAIAFFHGGGWAHGSPSTFHEACRRFARMGYVTATFQYRLSINEDGTTPHPQITPVECTKDARSAIRWLKKNAAELQVDPERIVVSGHSVGGQLSLAAALCNSVNETTDDLTISARPAALVLFSGTVNTLEVWCDNLMGERRKEIWSISPFHNLAAGLPPTLGFHGREDCTVPPYTVTLFLEKAKKLGNDIEYVFVDGKKHYLAEGNEKYSEILNDEILKKTDQFLEKHGLTPE